MERLFRVQAQAERKSGFRGKEERESEASNRVACGSRQVSVHEMRERRRKMYRTKIPDKKLGKMVKTTFGEAMTWSEGWTGREKF